MRRSFVLLAAGRVLAQDITVTLPVDANGRTPAMPADDVLEAHLRQSIVEHAADCAASCKLGFFCGETEAFEKPAFDTYSMGPVPSNDFPAAFDGDQQIFVSQAPLFSAAECDRLIALAEAEGEGLPTTRSGKYQIGKAWVKDMPQVLDWFNGALKAKLFPTLSAAFPALVPAPRELRAHTVAILKYNASHPQTDVHVDDALLAFTIALSPADAFEGGGTYFEHIDRVVDMPQGHVTFRPGSVRHAGSTVESGLRYVLGGFIAVADRVEHVRRLNDRGNRILLDGPDDTQLAVAEAAFNYGLLLNPTCSLCHLNLGDTLLRRERYGAAEDSLRAHLGLVPRDADAHYSLGNALVAQERPAEAVGAYEAAVAIAPRDFEAHLGLGTALAEVGEYGREAEAYVTALALRPAEVKVWLNLGISYTAVDDTEAAEAAFRSAGEADPEDARPPLNLGRYLAKLGRPAEAIEAFYEAAGIDAEYFEEVKLGVGTARAQQGRLAEAQENFASASRMAPKDTRLAASIAQMEETAALLDARIAAAGWEDSSYDLCGTPCRDVVDASSTTICAVTWEEGCADAPTPDGFDAASTVAQLCPRSCAWHTYQLERAAEGAAAPASDE